MSDEKAKCESCDNPSDLIDDLGTPLCYTCKTKLDEPLKLSPSDNAAECLLFLAMNDWPESQVGDINRIADAIGQLMKENDNLRLLNKALLK